MPPDLALPDKVQLRDEIETIVTKSNEPVKALNIEKDAKQDKKPSRKRSPKKKIEGKEKEVAGSPVAKTEQKKETEKKQKAAPEKKEEQAKSKTEEYL